MDPQKAGLLISQGLNKVEILGARARKVLKTRYFGTWEWPKVLKVLDFDNSGGKGHTPLGSPSYLGVVS